MKQAKVKQFNGQNGAVKNQFIIETEEGTFFQSYESIICFKPHGTGKIKLDSKYYNYSQTTVKYRNQFLNMTTKEVESAIKTGAVELSNLN